MDVAWTGILGGLASKRFDMIQSGMTITQERMKRVSFGVPYGEAARAFVVKKGTTDIAKPEDLANKVVGTELGSGTERFLRFLDGQLKAKGLGGMKEIKTYEHFADGYMDLEIGRCQAVLDMKFRVYLYLRRKLGAFQVVGPIGPRQFQGAAFRKDDASSSKSITPL